MNLIKQIFLIFSCSLYFHFGIAQQNISILPNLQDQALLDSLAIAYKPHNVLSYGDARDYMYGEVYLEDDSVECVYTGMKIFLPSDVDPSSFLSSNNSSNGINCEHTVPRSKGASQDNGNPFSDMHHLFPTRAQVNNVRANFPFANIDDNNTTKWYSKSTELSHIPPSDIDAYAEYINGYFEPRESHKGNVARAIFYFYTMYQEEADDADPIFFERQIETLCGWHEADPVDSLELLRTYKIAEMQDDLPNPFVLDCSLIERSYCKNNASCVIISNIKEEPNIHHNIYPNPITTNIPLRINAPSVTSMEFKLYNGIGENLGSYHSSSNNLILNEINFLARGSYHYTLRADGKSSNGILQVW